MPEDWFEPGGIAALAIAVAFAVTAVLVLAWLRGPGSEPHDPAVARDQVRWFAVCLLIFAAGSAIRAFWGTAGQILVSGLVLVAVAAIAVARRRAHR